MPDRDATPVDEDNDIIDWPACRVLRAETGIGFARILGYFREDGVKSVVAIEAAMARHDAVALVLPAHTLKGEARQFGARPLGALAERIEMVARDCIEAHSAPDMLADAVAALRPLFYHSLTLLENDTVPVGTPGPRPVFGRRSVGAGR